jgi:hypothetical protein
MMLRERAETDTHRVSSLRVRVPVEIHTQTISLVRVRVEKH